VSFELQPIYIKLALNLAAKFGYLRKEFYFDFLTAKSRSAKFRSWKILQASGFFQAYKRSYIGEDVYKLSYRGKKVLRLAGVFPVSSAHPLHFEHDDTIVRFILSLQAKGLVKNNYMSEKMLRREPFSWVSESLGHSLVKLPDLIFDLDLNVHNFKIALEVERTRKSKFRYDQWVQAYAKAEKLDLIIVAYNDHSVFESIQSAIKAFQYPYHMRPVVFCKIADVQKDWTNFPISINGRTILLESYIENLKKISQKDLNVPSDFLSEGTSYSKIGEDRDNCLN
jgi:hypothetical protein